MGFLSGISKLITSPITSLVGDVAGGLFGASEAEKNRKFQASQTGTQYQRAVKDLRAAGLNPILAAKTGGNAAASGSMPPIPDIGSSARHASKYRAEMDVMRAQADNLKATAQETAQRTEKLKFQTVQEQKRAIRDEFIGDMLDATTSTARQVIDKGTSVARRHKEGLGQAAQSAKEAAFEAWYKAFGRPTGKIGNSNVNGKVGKGNKKGPLRVRVTPSGKPMSKPEIEEWLKQLK